LYLECDGTTAEERHIHSTPVSNRLLLDYSDINLIKEVLKVLADNSSVSVDNDFGLVLQGNEFIRRINLLSLV